MDKVMKNLLFIIIAALLVLKGSVYTVNQYERALLLRVGKIVNADIQPGLHFKFPLFDDVKKFDARLFTLDNPNSEEFLTSENKNVLVDFYVKWRIKDLQKFYTATSGGYPERANELLNAIIKKGLKDEFGLRTIAEVVSGERDEVMKIMALGANEQSAELGVEVVDVRVGKIELPSRVSDNIFRRIRAERERVAKDLRARGQEEKEKIESDADRQRSVLLAEADREAEMLRGEGDAKAAETYARAYEKDAEFYSFYRSLNAYKNALSGKDDVLVVSPDSEFFKYFNQVSP